MSAMSVLLDDPEFYTLHLWSEQMQRAHPCTTSTALYTPPNIASQIIERKTSNGSLKRRSLVVLSKKVTITISTSHAATALWVCKRTYRWPLLKREPEPPLPSPPPAPSIHPSVSQRFGVFPNPVVSWWQGCPLEAYSQYCLIIQPIITFFTF